MLIDSWEESHDEEIATSYRIPWPKSSWKSPDGETWTPQRALIGYRPRVSDRWACQMLHYWIVKEQLEVAHIELPQPLQLHDPADPAWSYIEQAFGPVEREPCSYPIGRADVVGTGRDDCPLFVEFGGCAPLKFALNVALGGSDLMIVPYGSRYGFVFSKLSDEPLLQVKGRK